MARKLEPSPAQRAAEGNARLQETTAALLSSVGPSDGELIAVMRRGLELMGRSVACRPDEWSARDFVLGGRLVAFVLGIHIDMARDRAKGRAAA